MIGSGNTNFYDAYCLGADIISAKTQVPVMYRFELMGTASDVARVKEGLEEFLGNSSHGTRIDSVR